MKVKIRSIISLTVITLCIVGIEIYNACDHQKNYTPKQNAKIHLYGEPHGEEKFYQKELEAWGKFYEKGLRDLFVELPYYSAEFLNLWLRAEDDTILNQFYDDLDGTLSHVETYLDFCHTIKEKYPETVFHGTDVGHQYYSTGKRYLEYLESVGLKDSEEYELTKNCMEQGKIYYDYEDYAQSDSYREQKMWENFIETYDRIGQKEIMGIYGSMHIDLNEENIMAAQIQAHYGDVVESIYIFNLFTDKPFTFGFGYVGLIFMLLLIIPNLFWVKFKPDGYENYVHNENKVLGVLEKIGEVGATVLLVFFKDCNLHAFFSKSYVILPVLFLYILLAFILMVLYEIYWIRYFISKRTMKDFYRGIAGIPLAGAVIPVISLFILGLYSRNIAIIAVSVILGIGHIGIHYGHSKEI